MTLHQVYKRSQHSKTEARQRELLEIARELMFLKDKISSYRRKNAKLTANIHPQFEKSGINLLQYLALRQANLKNLQLRLAQFGLSSLGRCESYVMCNIDQILERVSDSLRVGSHHKKIIFAPKSNAKALTWLDAEKLLHQHSRDLFGPKPSDRHVYIMVTAPFRTEFNKNWMREVLKAGANLIRINCAHDTENEWAEMVSIIRKTAAELKLPCKILMDLGGPKIRTLSPAPKKLSSGDRLCLVGKITHKKKEIQCSHPEVLKYVNVGDRVVFDDGKIEAKVTEKTAEKLTLSIVRVPAAKTKLKAQKGINFPESHIKIKEITVEDLHHLDFVSAQADLIGLSFVQTSEAIRQIRRELKERTHRTLGIVLKIETQAGFQALPLLLLEVMKDYPCGVMIARGDLGVEVGFERMVEVQEEILWLCEAAHIPVIWATQVLETEAKTGMPSRAEVTDAASAVRAECVMLNKGPYIVSAVKSLDNILRRMESHIYKKRTLNRPLKVANLIPPVNSLDAPSLNPR
ncbi:MAG: pyruvate kinase [Pseudobdellovibrionaceae bacterium]